MRRENLTGQRFEHLTVLSFDGIDKKGNACWLCQCDCGKKVVVPTSVLKSGHKKSCGCMWRYDLKGKRFGKLTAVERIKGKWRCKCDCGNEIICKTERLVSGHKKSCGCDEYINGINVRKSIAGQRFGRLVAIEPVTRDKWRCKCDCGNEIIVARRSLVSGVTKSCGCLRRDFLKRRLNNVSTNNT